MSELNFIVATIIGLLIVYALLLRRRQVQPTIEELLDYYFTAQQAIWLFRDQPQHRAFKEACEQIKMVERYLIQSGYDLNALQSDPRYLATRTD